MTRLLKSRSSTAQYSGLYKEISLNIIIALFLKTEERGELEKMIPDLVSVSQIWSWNCIKLLLFFKNIVVY